MPAPKSPFTHRFTGLLALAWVLGGCSSHTAAPPPAPAAQPVAASASQPTSMQLAAKADDTVPDGSPNVPWGQ